MTLIKVAPHKLTSNKMLVAHYCLSSNHIQYNSHSGHFCALNTFSFQSRNSTVNGIFVRVRALIVKIKYAN